MNALLTNFFIPELQDNINDLSTASSKYNIFFIYFRLLSKIVYYKKNIIFFT